MIGFRLQLKQLPDGRLIFTIPLGYKILLFLIGLLIFVSLIITRQEGSSSIFVRVNTIPLIVCLLAFLGSAYHERWIFDREQDQVIYQHGIFVLHSNRAYQMSSFERVEIALFIKGISRSGRISERSIGNRSRLTLSLRMQDGITHRVEIYRVSQKQHVERAASIISEYCRIPFVTRGEA